MNKYEISFENYGLAPFDSSLKSLFFYGDANKILDTFKYKKKSASSSLMRLTVFTFAFFLILIWLK